MGRRRYLAESNCDDADKRKQRERQCVNSVCQGSADLIKVAMIRNVILKVQRARIVYFSLVLSQGTVHKLRKRQIIQNTPSPLQHKSNIII